MARVYTRTGDKGDTSLASGKRVSKAHPRLEAYGSVDELNSSIGVLTCCFPDPVEKERLTRIQKRVFVVSSHLALDDKELASRLPNILNEDILELEKAMDQMLDQMSPLQNFILPGGDQIIAFCHLSRTICRRAERAMIRLLETDPVDDMLITYINRLSDYLFVLARFAGHVLGLEEIKWMPDFREREAKL